MKDISRIFDFIGYQMDRFPKADMFCGKEDGKWIPYSTAQVKKTVDALSAGLRKLGLGGNEQSVEKQDKIALISKNRPEVLMRVCACQEIGVLYFPY